MPRFSIGLHPRSSKYEENLCFVQKVVCHAFSIGLVLGSIITTLLRNNQYDVLNFSNITHQFMETLHRRF